MALLTGPRLPVLGACHVGHGSLYGWQVFHGIGEIADSALCVPAADPAEHGAPAEPPLVALMSENVCAKVLAQLMTRLLLDRAESPARRRLRNP